MNAAMLRTLGAGILALHLVAMTGRGAVAQSLRGRVVAAEATTPVTGAIVLLVDSTGATVARAMAGSEGEFVLTAPATGAYTLRTLRLGFRPTTLGPVRVEANGLSDIVLTVNSVPVSLAAVQVRGRNVCLTAREQQAGNDVLAVWEEAQKALLSTLLTRSDAGLVMTTTQFERVLSSRTGHVMRQSVSQRTGPSSRPFVAPLAPDVYATAGYREEDKQGSLYRAPDADVLLANSFAETHCLRLAEHPADGEVGVTFEPLASARVRRDDGSPFVDVSGTLWLDRRSIALKRAEFRYTSVEPVLIDANAGGRLEFEYVTPTLPVIKSWSLVIPRIATTHPIGTVGRDHQQIAEVWSFGGEVTEARRGADLLWRAPRASLRGVVRLAEGGVAARATVRLAGTTYKATSDRDGRYSIDDILPGRYEVVVQSELGALLALEERKAATADVDQLHQTTLDLATGSTADMLRERCGSAQNERSVILGTVRDGNGMPTPGLAVRGRWTNSFVIRSNAVAKQGADDVVRTDSLGHYFFCNIERGRPVEMTVTSVAAASVLARTVARAPADSAFVVIDLVWHDPPAGTRLSGRVLTNAGAPIPNASVGIVGDVETTTDSLGRYTTSVPLGAHLLMARRVGYRQSIKSVTLSNSAPLNVTFMLEPITVLDARVVRGNSLDGGSDVMGFDARRQSGQGVYVTEDDIARRAAAGLDHLLASIPGLEVDTAGVVRVDRGRTSILGDNCAEGTQVFIDGVPVDGSFQLRSMSVRSIRGIEVYRGVSTVPATLRSPRMACGTVAIWTK